MEGAGFSKRYVGFARQNLSSTSVSVLLDGGTYLAPEGNLIDGLDELAGQNS